MFGPLEVAISGPEELVIEIAKDFDCKQEGATNGAPDISLSIDSSDFDISETHYSGKKTLYFNDDEICINVSPFFKAYVKGLFSEGTTEIRLILKKQSLKMRVLNLFKRALSLEYSTIQGQLRNHINNYSFLWSILAIKLLEKGCVFLHAGIFAKSQKAIIVTGTGGCGKTSTVINACRKLGYEFVSEDFGIVSREGVAFYCPKTISLYKSDFEFYSTLEAEVIGGLNLFSRLKWWGLTKILKRNTIVKAIPNQMFETCKTVNLDISKVYFFQRLKKPGHLVNDIDIDTLASRISWASYREIAPFLAILSGIAANKDINQNFETPEEIRIKMLNIYRLAFANTSNKLLSCELSTNPMKIMSSLNES